MKLDRWRGTPQQPGLMMALERGGRCDGVIYRLPDEGRQLQVRRVLYREIRFRENIRMMRWIPVHTAAGKSRALVFWAGPSGDNIASRLPLDEVACILARIIRGISVQHGDASGGLWHPRPQAVAPAGTRGKPCTDPDDHGRTWSILASSMIRIVLGWRPDDGDTPSTEAWRPAKDNNALSDSCAACRLEPKPDRFVPMSRRSGCSLCPMQHPCRYQGNEEDEHDHEEAILEGERVGLDGNDLTKELNGRRQLLEVR